MLNTFHTLDPQTNGSSSQWTVIGTTNAYDAVTSTSDDTTFLGSATAGNTSDFVCSSVPIPEVADIAGFYVHVRFRAAATGTVQITFGLRRGGALIASTTASVTGRTWVDQKLWVGADPSTSARFIASGLSGIGVSVQDNTGSPGIHVSKLYLEVVWMASEYRYDPLWGVVPDSVLGDLDWGVYGTQTASIVGSELIISDTSTTDNKYYTINIPDVRDDFAVGVTGRLRIVTTALSTVSFFGVIAGIFNTSNTIELCAFMDGPTKYIGLIDSSGDKNTPGDYIKTYAFDWSYYFTYTIIADADPHNYTNGVKVYINGDLVIEAEYSQFNATGASHLISFGTGTSTVKNNKSEFRLDYISWYVQRIRHKVFRGWRNIFTETNNVVYNDTDTDIIKPVMLSVPPIQTGQSPYCCQLTFANTSGIVYVEAVQEVEAVLYNLSVDYKVDGSGDIEVSIQRSSDMYYWNEGTASWQAASITVIDTSATRKTIPIASNVAATVPDNLIIRVGAAPGRFPCTVYVYRVYLTA